ncbi:MAG: PEP-CTERM sorting domain-containing protein [Planctomycetes bacterium]|nr:PEP-CTERM sorting domain-containing protein [Planctomycetota bacterium]
MKSVKTLAVILAIYVFALPLQATTIVFTSDGVNLSEGNYGTSMLIDNFIQVSALTKITLVDSQTGTIYLDSDKGLGVQTSTARGSEGISGGGRDQDEALIFDFMQTVAASSIVLGLYDYNPNDDDTVLTLTLNNSSELSFTKSHQNWNSAITYLGGEKTTINFGVLLGEGFGGSAARVSVMEPTGHVYVNLLGATTSTIPEPATMLLLCMGTLFLSKKPSLNRKL